MARNLNLISRILISIVTSKVHNKFVVVQSEPATHRKTEKERQLADMGGGKGVGMGRIIRPHTTARKLLYSINHLTISAFILSSRSKDIRTLDCGTEVDGVSYFSFSKTALKAWLPSSL
jgi:hypothetical protein